MLIRFKVGNFLSFNEPQELSMISGETRNHPDHIKKFRDINLLRVSAIYGANASGKSNVIKALEQSRRMIVSNLFMNSKAYFRPSPANKDKPSYFEFEFENNEKYYSYGFELLLSKHKIVSEWLYELSTEGENKVFFQRNWNEITAHGFEGDDKVRMEVYAKDMENSNITLFLNEINRRTRKNEGGFSVFSETFDWFSRMNVFGTGRAIPYDVQDLTENEKNEMIGFLKALGTGITDISYDPVENVQQELPGDILSRMHESMIRQKNVRSMPDIKRTLGLFRGTYRLSLSEDDEMVVEKITFKHGNPNVSFDMEEESEGTQRLYNLLSMIVSKAKDKVYVLDELDIKLHPQLTYRFVDLFLKEKTGTKNQLIFTTHESYLMDFRLLRRDEIWFVEKGKDESSSLYSLEDFNERTDRKIDKAYLEGRYGGVPLFSAIFPASDGETDEAYRE